MSAIGESPPLPVAGPGWSWRRAAAALVAIAGTFGGDRATKRLAEVRLPAGDRLSLLEDCLRLERVQNPGAFLGFGGRLAQPIRSLMFSWLVGLLVAVALIAAFHPRSSWRRALGAALVAGGGLGNLWDRLTQGGAVTDFLNLGIGSLRTGIFNVADVAIFLGVALLALPWERWRRPAGP